MQQGADFVPEESVEKEGSEPESHVIGLCGAPRFGALSTHSQVCHSEEKKAKKRNQRETPRQIPARGPEYVSERRQVYPSRALVTFCGAVSAEPEFLTPSHYCWDRLVPVLALQPIARALQGTLTISANK